MVGGVRGTVELGAGVLAARLLHRRRPLVVSWAVTSRCNLRCGYCGIWEGRPDELTTGQALSLIEEMAAAGTRRLSLTGGEPLLRKDVGQLVERASSLGLRVTMNTNGLLLPKRLGEIAGLAGVSISVDGPRRAHDRQRGAGSFDRAMEGLLACRDAGLPVSLMTVLTRHNLASVDSLLALARQHGVTLLVQPVAPYSYASAEAGGLAPDPGGLRLAIEGLIGRPEVRNSRSCLVHFLDPSGHGPDNCAAGRISCRIDPDGTIHPCGRAVRAPDAPDAREGFAAGFGRLGPPRCDGCFCASQVEANLVLRLDPDAIARQLIAPRDDRGRVVSPGTSDPAES